MRRWQAAAAAVAVLGAGCASRPAPLPPPPNMVAVKMVDYRFVFDPPRAAGRAVFSLTNAGRLDHNLTFVPLTEDVPPILDQLRGSVRRPVDPEVQVPAVHPGGRTSFAVDLRPGQRYALICFLRDRDDPPNLNHALRGMAAEFRARGPLPTTTTSEAGPAPSSETTPTTSGDDATTTPGSGPPVSPGPATTTPG